MTTSPVRIANSLRRKFEKLPNKDDWAPVGFPEFVRVAVRDRIIQEQRKASWVDEAPSEDDPLPQE